MVVAKLLQFIKALSGRKWTDHEISEDLAFLQDELQASFDQLTYFPIIKIDIELLMNIHQNSNPVISHGPHPIVMMHFGEKMQINSLIKMKSC